MRRVTVYTARECGLCQRALDVIREVSEEMPFELSVVSIDGNEALESSHRERLPVVEIDGEPAFVYFVDADALRRRLSA